MIDCAALLSFIVQSRKRVRTRKVQTETMLFNTMKNLQLQRVISIIRFHWHFQRQTSIVSSSKLHTAVMISQERQNDWNNLRNLSKHSYRINFIYSSHQEIIRKQWIRSFRFDVEHRKSSKHQKSKYEQYDQQLIERRFQQNITKCLD